MDLELEALIAKPGEMVAPKWNALIRYLRRITQLRSGREIRMRTGPDGTSIVADRRQAVFTPHFAVRLAGDEVTIGTGLVNGIVPVISGVQLDGLLPDGKPSPKPVPKLKVTEPSAALRSWVCVTVQIDLKTGMMIEKEPVGIIHLSDADLRVRNGYSTDIKGQGIYPLAMVVWTDKKTPARVHQITMHDLQHSFLAAGKGLPARHFFRPA